MKKTFALAAIILSFSNISADELFINCETTSAREAVKEGKIKKKALSQESLWVIWDL